MASENIGVQGGADGDGYKAYINFPTPYGTFIARQVVKNKAGDVEKIHMFQDATGLSSVPRTSGAVAPTFDLGLFREVARSAASEEEQVLRLTAALAPYNQPEVLQDRSWVAHMLEKAGIRNGNFVQPPDTSLTAARDTAKDSAIALRTTAGFVQDLGNRWKCSSALINGDFKSFYSARFFVAERGYLQLTSDQAIYPTFYSAPGVATLEIEPKQACLFTFSSKPKLQPTGFWSLTLYGEDHLLVSNQLDRYALGDRSNLRYSDGTLLREVNDGKFQILIQPSAPPAHWIDK